MGRTFHKEGKCGGPEEQKEGQSEQSRACRKDGHSQISQSCVAGNGDGAQRLQIQSLLDSIRPGTSCFQNSGPAILSPAPRQAKPELTSKVGIPGLQDIKPNKTSNYLCDHCRSRHLCLIKALVTFESGVLWHCVFIWLCSVPLRELNFYPMNKFQTPSVPSSSHLIYKASLIKCCVFLFDVGSQEA